MCKCVVSSVEYKHLIVEKICGSLGGVRGDNTQSSGGLFFSSRDIPLLCKRGIVLSDPPPKFDNGNEGALRK